LFSSVKEKLCVGALSQNNATSAVRFLLNDSELYARINWENFCENPNDLVIDHLLILLEKNNNEPRIVWETLCLNTNPRVFRILQENKKKIDWDYFLKNPICFAYNYEKIRERCAPIKQEILNIFLHPDNVISKIESERNADESDFDVISRLDL
jgi:hypothetical protein